MGAPQLPAIIQKKFGNLRNLFASHPSFRVEDDNLRPTLVYLVDQEVEGRSLPLQECASPPILDSLSSQQSTSTSFLSEDAEQLIAATAVVPTNAAADWQPLVSQLRSLALTPPSSSPQTDLSWL